MWPRCVMIVIYLIISIFLNICFSIFLYFLHLIQDSESQVKEATAGVHFASGNVYPQKLSKSPNITFINILQVVISSILVVRWSCWKKREAGGELRSTFLSNMTERNKHHENLPRISNFQSLTQIWCVISFLRPIFDRGRIPFISSVMLGFCWSNQIYPYASFLIFAFSLKPWSYIFSKMKHKYYQNQVKMKLMRLDSFIIVVLSVSLG